MVLLWKFASVGAPIPSLDVAPSPASRSCPGLMLAESRLPSVKQRAVAGRVVASGLAQHLQQLACIIPRGRGNTRLAKCPPPVLIIADRRALFLHKCLASCVTLACCSALPLSIIEVVCTPSSSLVMCIPCRLHLRACSHCVPSGAVVL